MTWSRFRCFLTGHRWRKDRTDRPIALVCTRCGKEADAPDARVPGIGGL
jgi:hypothetical protein